MTMTDYFTPQNTPGYTQNQLDELNVIFEIELMGIDADNFAEVEKLARRIQNNFHG